MAKSDKDLIKKRGSIKCRLTFLKKYVMSFDGLDLSLQQQSELKLRMTGSQGLLNDFNKVQSEIEENSLESDIEKQLESREEFEREYYSILALAECLTNSDERSTDSSKIHVPSASSNSIKLPTISIPEFDGSYEHWLEFRDTFISLVHNCKTITQIQKFHYLKSSLTGIAKSVIDSLEFSANNYEVAWELLMNRFDNTHLLVHNHVKSIFSMQALTKESPVQLRKLIDLILKNLRALKLLGEPTEYWDTLIIYTIVSKLDSTTERNWEERRCQLQNNSEFGTIKLDDLLQFLRNRADMLETLIVSHSKSNIYSSGEHRKHNTNNVGSRVYCNIVANKCNAKPSQNKAKRNYKLCLMCNAPHPLYSCQKFLDLSVHDRLKFVTNHNLCINCMRPGHAVQTCIYGPCRKCERIKHNSLLCEVNNTEHNVAHITSQSAVVPAERLTNVENAHPHSHSFQAHNVYAQYNDDNMKEARTVLLSTAVVDIRSASGVYLQARAILDSGSERSFITQSLCDKLNTQILQSTQHIHGVGNSITKCSQSCNIELKSRSGNYNARIQCLILPQITSRLPATTLNINKFVIPENITLADPGFFESLPIDLLIGADLFWELINEGKLRLNNGPFLQNTKLGWVVSGSILSLAQINKNVKCNFVQSAEHDTFNLEQLVRRFWDIEELPASSVAQLSVDERACERHFLETTKRVSNGRFSVRFPFMHSPELLGDSRAQAERRFYALERKLDRNVSYKNMYKDFINEYIKLGHMSLINNYGTPHYFMPHHGVFREHATTTKLRVVFDASMPSSTGVSLNDLQMVGPAIQGDLIAILLRFRENRFVACADIEKMYRQVLIDESQRDLQLILWRDESSHDLNVYRLNTVTYGTASAPFLSCRCLKYLADECEIPCVKDTINTNFYVDDLICGANNISELNNICEGTTVVLNSACFVLRKWVFNFDHANPNDNSQVVSKHLSFGDSAINKTLGIGWNNKSDELNYSSQINPNDDVITKRIILSTASQIYDPLGLISPVITIAKSLLQKCWLLKLDWDEPVPTEVAIVFSKFINCLASLSILKIPRYVMCLDPIRIELHIFTDASQIAFGACAFIRTIDSRLAVTVRLLCAKGKIAPTKPITIPRLELSGAVLGARLYKRINESLRSKINHIIFWTDSTIVLGWLGMPTNLLKPFVQNRTAEIHELTKDLPWRHVSGKDNPADLVSRGLGLDALNESSLWWNGPQFLHDPNFEMPCIKQIHIASQDELPELKSNTVCQVVTSNAYCNLFPFHRYSKFSTLKRVAAYVIRFIYNARHKGHRRTSSLTVSEQQQAELILAKFSQQESFPEEYNLLLNNNTISKNTKLLKLHLFMDNDHIIRVGGRIGNSQNFSYNKKYPVLLATNHHFTVLLFRDEHLRLMHAGPQTLLYTLRETWWPIGGRNLARKTVRTCIKCARCRPSSVNPIMGNLPQERLEPGFPFLKCGVDMAGPIFTLNRKGRGAKLEKSYICLFVCFVTRACHLELVSDLSSDAYLLALKRFISRRGKPLEIFSDNGKNFIGLKNEFKQFLNTCSDDIKEYATSQNIKFKMIPNYASHFGGLWEAGIKSCKHHLRRVVGNAHLTFEEFSTVLTQVEAVLNSRPLTPMSADPHDFLPLSPAHFLVGRPLTAPVAVDLHDVPENRLTRYHRVEQIRQHFWSRWSKEYVSEMQTRSKWYQHKGELQENTLVLIKDDRLPPLKWSLGRIIKTYPGKDGVSRVADVRKADGIVRRAFSKICPLPLPDSVKEL